MAQLVPLNPVVKVTRDMTDFVALEAGRSDKGLKATVQAVNGTVKASRLVAFGIPSDRQAFAKLIAQEEGQDEAAIDSALVELSRQVEAALRKADADEEEEPPKPSAAQRLIEIGLTAELFHSDRAEAFARLTINGHRETWSARSRAFKEWLSKQFYEATGKPPNAQATEDALRVLEANARFDGQEYPLAVRMARHDGDIWIDLGDVAWQMLHVDQAGWQVVTDVTFMTMLPPLFRRYAPCAAQVVPTRGGSLDRLRDFLNVRDEAAWRQLIVWLVAAFLPDIAHPILILSGEQGSCKSTTARLLGMLVDPSRTPLRSEPRDLHDWIQIADHSWLVVLDNLSYLPSWLSDALCRASTGEGFSKRQLYSDAEDIIIEFRRTVVLTGIECVATRPDVLDRSILLALEPISPEHRRAESEVLAEFAKARPALLGALLDIVSGVLSELPNVTLDELPRMADFAKIGIAVERVMGWPDGAFLEAYTGNIAEQHAEALSASEVGEAVISWVATQSEPWQGSTKKLLEELDKHVGDGRYHRKHWPRNAKALNGQLRRIAPNLRGVGISIDFLPREGRERPVRLAKRRTSEEKGEQPSQPSQPSSQSQNGVTVDQNDDDQSSRPSRSEAQPSQASQSQNDGCDGYDGQSLFSSNDLARYGVVFAARERGELPMTGRIGNLDYTDVPGHVANMEATLARTRAGKGIHAHDARSLKRELDTLAAWWQAQQQDAEREEGTIE